MALKLQQKLCVLIGRLNRAIIRGPWLAQHGLAPSSPRFEIKLPIHGGPLIEETEGIGLRWRTLPDRLEVYAEGDADPGDSVATLVKLLQHTPFVAVGNNFHFEMEPEDGVALWRAASSKYAKAIQSLVGAPIHSSVSLKIPFEDAELNFTMEGPSEGPPTIRLNFHRETPTWELAAAAAHKWAADFEAAQKKTEELLAMMRGMSQ
jgi:hypothetical protein